MVHYHVWFTLKDGVREEHGLEAVEAFLASVCAQGEAAAFRLTRESGTASFHALTEFADDEALGRAMKNQHARGIREGAHGKIVDVVSDFRVKVIQVPIAMLTQYACEI